MDKIFFDFETRSCVDLTKHDAVRYAADTTTSVICLGYQLNDGEPRLWVEGDPFPPELKVALKVEDCMFVAHNVFFDLQIWNRVFINNFEEPLSLLLDPNKCMDTIALSKKANIVTPYHTLDALAKRLLGDQKKKDGVVSINRLSKPKQKGGDTFRTLEEEPEVYQNMYSYCKHDVTLLSRIFFILPMLSKFEHALFTQTLLINCRGVYVDTEISKKCIEIIEKTKPDAENKLIALAIYTVHVYLHCEGDKDKDSECVKEFEKHFFKLDWEQSKFYGQVLKNKIIKDDKEAINLIIDRIKTYPQKIMEKGGKFKLAGKPYCIPIRISQIARITEVLKYWDLDVESLDSDHIDTYMAREDNNEIVTALLQIRKDWGSSASKKFEAILDKNYNGRVYNHLNYYGASMTGRWSGQGLQVQNIPRGVLSHEEVENMRNRVLQGSTFELAEIKNFSGLIRSCILPKDKIIVSDYSSIELRILMWFCGEGESLQMLVDGVDMYRHMASGIYEKGINEISAQERHVGKNVTLGFGYGLGHKKFAEIYLGGGSPDNIKFAEKLRKIYFKKFPKVSKLWVGLEYSIQKAMNTTDIIIYKNVKFQRKVLYGASTIVMTLPSNREIYFHNVKKEQGMFEGTIQITFDMVYKKKISRGSAYGGRITDYICQGLARDIMAYAKLNLEHNHGDTYQIIASIHDEVLCNVKEENANLEEYESIMCELPNWAEGIPISVSGGFIGDYYRK